MKRKSALLGALICTVLMGLSAQADTVYTVKNTMNFRALPSFQAQSIGSVPRGSSVSFVQTQGEWDYVSFNGYYGWIHTGNLISGALPTIQQTTYTQPAATTQPATTQTASSQTVKVLYGMNFRATPGMDGVIMNLVPAGSLVQYYGTLNGWDHINYNGVDGWIAGGRITTQISNTTVTPSAPAATQTSTAATYSYSGNTVFNSMNFRSAPGLTGAIIGLVPVGSQVQVLSSENGWDRISYQGTIGWIKGGNIR